MSDAPPAAPTGVPLFERAPHLVDTVPYLSLGRYPSPVESVELVDGARRRSILVKRDDLAADGYAGNKVRKLEFILADARRRGITRLVTAGATGSHHAFATAYHGIRSGFAVSLVLFPQSLTSHVREMLLLDAAAGAELLWASRMEAVPYGMWRARFRHRREAVCLVPPGGSSDVGTFGYVNGALELAAQLASGSVPRPSAIHVAAGTLGTAAGIGIGLAWAGARIPLIATRITSRLLTNERALASLVRSTLSRLAAAGADGLPSVETVMDGITLRHDQIGAGYGRATEAGARATEVFAGSGLLLDATYTAKAAASLLADDAAAAPPLFWHTLSAATPDDLRRNAGVVSLPPRFAKYLET